jgi:thiaminase/transcriptional activator TenA
MLQDTLREIRDPVLRRVQDHPFWAGLRDGTLDGAALTYFVEQDTEHLLPAFARALARCAASAPSDDDTLLLGQSILGTLDARDRLRGAATRLAGEIGIRAPRTTAPIDPVTLAHTSFLAAATATSFPAGLGALLPMIWFNAAVADRLRDDTEPASRYRPWVTAYHPGDDYGYAVDAFLAVADRTAANCSASDRAAIVEYFSIGAHYEWAFAGSCIDAVPHPHRTRKGTPR